MDREDMLPDEAENVAETADVPETDGKDAPPDNSPDVGEPEEMSPAGADEDAAREPEGSYIMGTLYEFVSVFVTAFVAIAIIFTFIFRLIGVTGYSMNNTLYEGDWLMVRTYYTEPKYKDIVIITQPNFFDEVLVKRVIAVGGQEIDIDFNKGIVYVDGEPLSEDYTAELTTRHDDPDTKEFPTTVPEGYVFVMGDNRNHSTDSRSEKVGFIKVEYILGKAVGRLFPLQNGWKIYK